MFPWNDILKVLTQANQRKVILPYPEHPVVFCTHPYTNRNNLIDKYSPVKWHIKSPKADQSKGRRYIIYWTILRFDTPSYTTRINILENIPPQNEHQCSKSRPIKGKILNYKLNEHWGWIPIHIPIKTIFWTNTLLRNGISKVLNHTNLREDVILYVDQEAVVYTRPYTNRNDFLDKYSPVKWHTKGLKADQSKGRLYTIN